MNKISCFFFFLFSFIGVYAQSNIGGKDLQDVLFGRSVKSCDEFMARFNEEELFPDLDKLDPELGQKNFFCLFDVNLAEKLGKNKLIKEVYSIYDKVKAANVKLSYESNKWYAELRTQFLFKTKPVELGIVMQTTITPKGLPCWCIVGINGMEKVGFSDSLKRKSISPEQHEAEFIEIESDFKFETKSFSQFRSPESHVDALSYFFALIESGTLTFDKRLFTIFHFLDIPSYVFSVKYFDRKMSNTGWLVYDYKTVNSSERKVFMKKLLGK